VDLLISVAKGQVAAAGAGGDVEAGDGAQAGTVEHRNILKIDDDVFVARDEGTDFVSEQRCVLAGEAAVAFDDEAVVELAGFDTETGWAAGHGAGRVAEKQEKVQKTVKKARWRIGSGCEKRQGFG
jgi:hypothetical protein